MAKLLLATTNRGKTREYQSLLEGLPLDLVTPDRLGLDTSVEERGASLEENARLKADFYAGQSGLITLADDSGLEVDALGGAPGVRSARYAGENATDRGRVGYLLARLKAVPWPERIASFKCVIAIVAPGGGTEMCYGECRGLIAFEPRGENGFGYDPVFYLPEYGRTMAELPLGIKNRISHRGQAAKQACLVLERLLEQVKP